jgi:hypothetical protein
LQFRAKTQSGSCRTMATDETRIDEIVDGIYRFRRGSNRTALRSPNVAAPGKKLPISIRILFLDRSRAIRDSRIAGDRRLNAPI